MSKETINPEQDLLQDEDMLNENIFEDFTGDSSLDEEVKKIENRQQRDVYFYLKKSSLVFKVINLVLFMGIGFFVLYAFFQQNVGLANYSYLKPVCGIFLGGNSYVSGQECYPLMPYLESKKEELEQSEERYTTEISSILGDIYEIEDFIYSKVATFLLDKSKNRTKPLEILAEFDKLKNIFEPIDKSKVICSDISINSKSEFEAICEAYSSDWDSELVQIDSGIVGKKQSGGTSISIASSFLDFLEKHPESKFQLIDKQKVFFSENISGLGIYTKKTVFNVKMRYVDGDSLLY